MAIWRIPHRRRVIKQFPASFITAATIQGTACWGHVTGVTQSNIRTFSGNWTGTGAIESSGDGERIALGSGEYMESEAAGISGNVSIAINSYSAGDAVTIKYKTSATEAGLSGEAWSAYSVPFISGGFVKIRLERA